MNLREKLVGLMLVGVCGFAHAADSYPDRPIRLIVPFSTGGPTDALARALAKTLSEQMKQAIIVENRTGAGGSIGMEAVANAKPDGYTIGMGHTGSNSIYTNLYAQPRYDPLVAFEPITPVVSYTNVLLVNEAIPAKTVHEFIAWARANPKSATYASGGNGATNHLSGELLNALTDAGLTHVPYKGNSLAMIDVLSGTVSSMFDILITALPQIEAKKVRALAVTSAARSPYLPDVPTMAEAGIKGYDEAGNDLWFGLFAPAGTPQPIVQRLHSEVVKAIQAPELQKTIEGMAYNPWTLQPTEFRAFLAEDQQKWGKVVELAGAKVQ